MKSVLIPDIGTPNAVSVIEVNIKPGDKIAVNDTIMTLESDKAAMDVPASEAGVVASVAVKVGDKVKQGDLMYTLEASGTESVAKAAAPAASAPVKAESAPLPQPAPFVPPPAVKMESETASIGIDVYASPAVRRLARELGVDVSTVPGSGRKGRIQTEDLHGYVKKRLAKL